MSNQFGRKATLIVSTGSNGLDLSQLRFKFEVRQADTQAPNTLYVRIYNLAPATVKAIQGEFTTITLQAGYEKGNFGIIFQGTIKQFVRGKERNVDSFLDIWAADGDEFYNFGMVNQTLAAGSTPKQILDSITKQNADAGKLPYATDVNGLVGGIPAQALARGKVLFGMTRDYARDWAAKNGFRWSIQNGQAVLVPVTGYRPGEAVVLSSTTGLIGVPEATSDGVHARILLNPLVRIGCLVQIAQADINTLTVKQLGLSYQGLPSAAVTTAAGFYRVLVSEFIGDTRGQEWYCDLTCLAVDTSAPAGTSVQAAG
ncbi:hypothetical protein [Caballeronia sp. Sq4a]|uniref:phage protein n=1 Tax=Caballeronia sp. Sq4a TaxID=2878152 RepID=UPI0020C11D03|nr:hypothetical protein [Caballeronia sp. Sq4a]